jgi:hypothetical protein
MGIVYTIPRNDSGFSCNFPVSFQGILFFGWDFQTRKGGKHGDIIFCVLVFYGIFKTIPDVRN